MTGAGNGARGEVVVCVRGGPDELRERTLQSLRAHTPSEVAIRELAPAEDPFAATAPADVVVVEPGCLVASGWLEGLRAAAIAHRTIGTAAPLTQHDLAAGPHSPPNDELQLPSGASVDLVAVAAQVRDGSLRLRPRLPTGAGPCLYVRRSALELVGAGARFSERCVEHGLSHVLADDVLVLDERPDAARQPRAAPEDPRRGPLARSLSAARRALGGFSAVIDATTLHGPTTGTHVHVLELIAGLARTESIQLTAIVPDRPSEDVLARLSSLPAVSLLTYEEATRAPRPPADVVHRPYQLGNPGDLSFLGSLGERLILTQQDLIAFHNPAYFPSREAWEAYRRLTRLGLAAADRVVFFTSHTRDDALAEELVTSGRASVVHLGVDHPAAARERQDAPAPPAGATRLADGRCTILCLGTDLHHKNRLFALRMLEQLKTRHGWDGMLVFAGPTAPHGSSRADEARLISEHPELAAAVLDVGAVTEPEKAWLFARATLVVYPSVIEGFGLVPFEAAAHRVPCMWAPGSSLSELLPDAAAAIVPWDAERSAERALALMEDSRTREDNLQAISTVAAALTWDATAARLLEVYRATADAPAVAAGAGGLEALTEDAARLVGPRGELPPDVHRPLLALATHPRIAAPVFGALKAGYRASYEFRRRRRGDKQPGATRP